MSSELSPSSGEFPFDSSGLVRAMALARIVASSARRSSVVSVSAGGAKAMSLGMGSEPPEAVCSVFAGLARLNQAKTICCRSPAKPMVRDSRFTWRTPARGAVQSQHRLAGLTQNLENGLWGEEV
jgi:hypothetical protein